MWWLAADPPPLLLSLLNLLVSVQRRRGWSCKGTAEGVRPGGSGGMEDEGGFNHVEVVVGEGSVGVPVPVAVAVVVAAPVAVAVAVTTAVAVAVGAALTAGACVCVAVGTGFATGADGEHERTASSTTAGAHVRTSSFAANGASYSPAVEIGPVSTASKSLPCTIPKSATSWSISGVQPSSLSPLTNQSDPLSARMSP